MTKIRVLVADDHAIVRTGLSQLLNAQPDIEVVGEAADGNEAITKSQEIRPDVLTLDLSMRGINSVQTIECLHKRCPETRVLVLTMHDEPAYMRAVLAAGGAGYVVKTAANTEILSAVRAVSGGRIFVDLSLSENVTRSIAGHPARADRSPPGGLAGLSEREREVFELLAAGYTNQAAADRLFLSVKTVETYRARLGNKLGMHNRADFVRFAVETGLLRPTSLGHESAPTNEREIAPMATTNVLDSSLSSVLDEAFRSSSRSRRNGRRGD